MYYTVLILQSCRYPQEVKKVQAVQKVRKCKRNAFFDQLLSHDQMFRGLICCFLKRRSHQNSNHVRAVETEKVELKVLTVLCCK